MKNDYQHDSILAFRNTLRHQRPARRGQISNFQVDIEFLKMADDNNHGSFRAMRVDKLNNFLTQWVIPCSEKKKDELVDLELLGSAS